MAWKGVIGGFLRSTPMISMYGGIISTGVYVAYKDYNRLQSIISVYKTGNILAPYLEHECEVEFQNRPSEESYIKRILENNFSNEYYVINGEVGVGKTRTVLEVVRELMKTRGQQRLGAPIFVSVDQGKSFPDSLAAAINFNFDEHINFKSFLDITLRIDSIPKKDDTSKLIRVLEVLEESAFAYMLKNKKPVVIVIDSISSLNKNMPGALEKLQDKAKMWADCNIIKLVFINNDEEIQEILQTNSSSWSRAATPFVLEDLTKDEAISFLLSNYLLKRDKHTHTEAKMKPLKFSKEEAEIIYNVVGGRIIYLVTIKREYMRGIPLEKIILNIKDREREKFVNVSRSPALWKFISLLRSAPEKCMKLSKLIKATNKDDVDYLSKINIIKYVQDDIGTLVKFNSLLTENIIEELESLYQQELLSQNAKLKNSNNPKK